MRRSIVFLLVLAACGGGGTSATTAAPDSVGETISGAPSTTSASSGAATTLAPDEITATTDSGRPGAPEFTLELGDGGAYTLSEGSKPVYMIFWAEW
jgi:hypothetical protein